MGWNTELPPAESYTLGDERLDGLIREITDTKRVAIDTETDGLILHKSIPYYWSLSWEGNGRERRVTLPANTLQCFKYAFNDPYKEWILANAKFDMHMLGNVGYYLSGRWLDVSVMHALLYDGSHALKDMARQLLGWRWTDFSDTFGKIRSGYCVCGGTKASHFNKDGICKKTGCRNFRQVGALDVLRRAERENPEKLCEYAANDAYGTYHVFKRLEKELSEATAWSLYADQWPYITTQLDYFHKTEAPFTKVLFECERNGLKVNREYLEQLAPELHKALDEISFEVTSIAGKRINISSDPQLRDFFFGEHGLKPKSYTSGGKSGVKLPSVNEKYLSSIADRNPSNVPGYVAHLCMEYKAIRKQLGTYIEKMPGRLDQYGRVHMRLNQDIARTGRLSSSDPNMQNVTGGEKDRFKLRNAFIADDGYQMVVADYSQLEMRLLAAASQEEAMMEIFHKNWDIHMGNASLVYGIPYEDMVMAKQVDKDVKQGVLPEAAMTAYVWKCLNARSDVKTIGFGLNYGMKEKALSRRLGCSVEEAIEKIDKYMDTYPAVRAFFESAVDDAHAAGFAYTLMGRRRRLEDLKAADNYTRYRAERQASNLPIQGTAAEVCKMAMISLWDDRELRDKYGYRMCLQVHDEIVGECPTECVSIVKERVKEYMENPLPSDIGVPLTVDIASGPTWGSAK